MKKFRLIIFLLPLLLASCVTSRRVNYFQKPDKQIPAYADTLQYEDYVLRKDDRLYIYVYSLDETISKMYNAGMNSSYMRQNMMNGNGYGNNGYGSTNELYTYLVDEEGYIDFPKLGKIYVLGKTTREVKYLVEEALSTLLKDTQGYKTISVEVNIVQRTYSVIGMQSGQYPIRKEKMTIFEALAQAGDLQDYADRGKIKLVREKNGETVIKTFDVRSEDIVNSEYYYIEPNDIIYVRRFNGYSFGINHFTAAVGVVSSTLSLGVFVYTIVQTGINHVNKYKKGGN